MTTFLDSDEVNTTGVFSLNLTSLDYILTPERAASNRARSRISACMRTRLELSLGKGWLVAWRQ